MSPTDLNGFKKMTPEEQKKYVENHGGLSDNLTIIEHKNTIWGYDRKVYYFLHHSSFWIEEKVEFEQGEKISHTFIAFPNSYNRNNWRTGVYKNLSANPPAHMFLLKRFNGDEFKYIATQDFNFFLNFAEWFGWKRNFEKAYKPEKLGDFILIETADIETIVAAVDYGLNDVSFDNYFFNDWDDEQVIADKCAATYGVKYEEFEYLKEMVIYLREHKNTSFGLYVMYE